MDDLGVDQEFLAEEAENAIEDAVKNCFGITNDPSSMNILYNKEKVNDWCGHIADTTIKNLLKLNKRFKYVISVVIQQNTGAGIQSATCAYQNTTSDGVAVIQKEFPDMIIIVTVFGMQT